MKIETKVLSTLLGMILLVALVGGYAVDRQHQTVVLAATAQARDAANVVSALLASEKLPAASLQKIVDSLHRTQGRDVSFMDAKQVILADVVREEIGKVFANDPNDEVGRTIKDRKARTFIEKNRDYPTGIKQIVVPVEGDSGEIIGAVVLEYTSLYNELTRSARLTSYQVALAAISSIIIALLIAWYMGRSIALPLRQLTRGLTGFARGQVEMPMPNTRKDEIGELTAAFGHMMTEREQTEKALGTLRDNLEVRVLKRTEELGRANETLLAENEERKRTERALRDSEQKFQQLANHITDVFWITSPDLQTMHYVSAAYETIWGRSIASLYANPHGWIEAIVPEDHPVVRTAFAELCQSRPEISVEYRIRRPDGSIRWVHDRGFQVRSETGELIRLTGVVRDVTEQKRAEVTARETEQRFRSYFELGLIGAVITSPAKGCLEVNDEICRILGYEREELLLMTWEAMTHPDDLAADMAQFERILSGEIDRYVLDKRFIRKDGRVIDTIISVACIRRADRSIDYCVALLQDVTEAKKAGTAIRQAEDKYRSIYENSNEGIFQTTPGGQLISANPALARIFGYDSPEDLAQCHGKTEKHRYCKPGLREEFKALMEKRGQIKDFEYEVTRADGERIWISENARVVRDAAGQSVYYEGSAQDVTARKRAEEELFQSRETLRGILDHIPQRVFWKDRDLVYQGCNHAFAIDMGFPDTSSVLGKTDYDAVWKSIADAYRADDQAVLDSDEAKGSFEEPGMNSEGHPRWLRTSKIPLHDWRGEVTGVLGTYEDVTAHKLAKLEIERLNTDLERRVTERTRDVVAASAEAERANRAKSEFLSRTSHELRTPMNAILGFGQLLGMDETLGPDSRESVEQILNAGGHLLTLIDEVLDISNAESGSIVLSPQRVAVGPLLREILSLVRPLCAHLHVQLEPAVALEKEWTVLADPQRLKQILLNLLANAIKYNRPSGSVRVECVLQEEASPPALRFYVRDTGLGISAEDIERLFVPFNRLGAERRHPYVVGTGLGLALCKRLIELMGGALGVESVVDEGSAFWIDVPLAPLAQAELVAG